MRMSSEVSWLFYDTFDSMANVSLKTHIPDIDTISTSNLHWNIPQTYLNCYNGQAFYQTGSYTWASCNTIDNNHTLHESEFYRNSTGNYYLMSFKSSHLLDSANRWYIYWVTGTVIRLYQGTTIRASYTKTFAQNTVYKMTIEMVGNVCTFKLDGVTLFSYTCAPYGTYQAFALHYPGVYCTYYGIK